jgi:hypothetical protein
MCIRIGRFALSPEHAPRETDPMVEAQREDNSNTETKQPARHEVVV